MPHINRIRVNNVKYNFGTQFYDDFMMRFSCKNTIYDLANGGGKSVLMLLLLQNLIPNCTLDDKQPIEKLFRTNKGSTTIHSMIEWSLSDVHIKDGFKYMLTGFCARKAKEQGEFEENADGSRNGTAIEYFNYCIFYRKFNDNDIKNFPLTQNGERITYSRLKNYLKDLQRKDYNLEVKIFERKGDYQRFIADYGLYESEWEIIRGINKTEGHVRTYFETNYKNTRKVVEDLLIEEIIEKSFRNKYANDSEDGNLAETLLNIKDKLLELSNKKEEINNFDRQIEIIDGFAGRISSIRQLYVGIENAFIKIKKAYNSLEVSENNNKSELEAALNERKNVLAEKNNLSAKVETAKVLVDMGELEKLEAELSRENEKLVQTDEEVKAFIERLNILEGGNYYLEYIQCKKEYDKLKLVMNNILKDNKTLLDNLKELAAIRKMSDDERINELTSKINEEKSINENETELIAELKTETKDLDNKLAVLDYKVADYDRKSALINKEIIDKKNMTSLLLPTDADKMCATDRDKLAAINDKAEELESKCETKSGEVITLRLKLRENDYKLNDLEKRKNIIEENNNKLLNSSEKLSKLKQVYDAEELEELLKKIEKTYKNMLNASSEAEKKLVEIDRQLKALELGRVVNESAALSEVLEYIRRYHSNTAVSGAQYLAELPEETRFELVKYNPVLPYAIIVKDNFEQTIMDTRIKENLENGYTVPIINGTKLAEENVELINSENVFFIGENAEEFSSDKIKQNIERIKLLQEKLNKEYLRKLENEQVVKEDYLFINHIVNDVNDEEILNPKKALEKVNSEILEKIEVSKNLKEEIAFTENDIRNVKEELADLRKEKEETEQEINVLSEISRLITEFNVVSDEKTKASTELERLKKEATDSSKRLAATENMSKQRQIRINSMEEELDTIKKDWSEKYSSYYDETVYKEVRDNEAKYNGRSRDDIETELMALIESLKKENYAVADKEKLLNNYQVSMEKNLQHIDYMGVDIEVLKNQYDNNELVVTSPKDLSDIKRQADRHKAVKKEIRQSIQEMRSNADKLKGKISHAINIITDKYGEFDKNLIKESEIDTFLNENARLLSDLTDKTDRLAGAISEMEHKAVTINMLKRDINKLMTKSDIKPDIKAGTFEENADIEAECKNVSEQLDKFIDEKYKRSEEFEREMSLLNDTLKKLNAFELASEIRMNVSMPADLDETDELIKMLKETNEYIDLEKQRILKGIEDMQVIKDNFENQCIQTCTNIKTELDRLSKLSRITMEDETIPVINLRIPYVKEEVYKDRMSEYIDRVAKGADSFEKTEDKLKYIRNNLSWKKMFSVIVTDMNSIKLNLYKRERIADQSRFLPYEEAVGSTGQSQGIYIQFLISIINYISSINSKNADASKLKKVIFIDNPFGAAKDIYIWEPIFKLLKTNNVQLIVPARGATPAISGRFDVNYVLGQKISNGRQQTVVVDYFSNVNNDELDYTTLSYEQTALF